MIKAVLYTRAKRDVVTGFSESLNGQEIRLTKYCKKNNIEVSRVYHDFPFEGEPERTQFIKMIYDFITGNYKADLCLFTSADKLSEDFEEFFFYAMLIKNFGLTPRVIDPSNICIITIKD